MVLGLSAADRLDRVAGFGLFGRISSQQEKYRIKPALSLNLKGQASPNDADLWMS